MLAIYFIFPDDISTHHRGRSSSIPNITSSSLSATEQKEMIARTAAAAKEKSQTKAIQYIHTYNAPIASCQQGC